jgi:hypothetical protein
MFKKSTYWIATAIVVVELAFGGFLDVIHLRGVGR